jgi:hypothetical protein
VSIRDRAGPPLPDARRSDEPDRPPNGGRGGLTRFPESFASQFLQRRRPAVPSRRHASTSRTLTGPTVRPRCRVLDAHRLPTAYRDFTATACGNALPTPDRIDLPGGEAVHADRDIVVSGRLRRSRAVPRRRSAQSSSRSSRRRGRSGPGPAPSADATDSDLNLADDLRLADRRGIREVGDAVDNALRGGRRALDLACGPGRHAVELRRLGSRSSASTSRPS